MVDVVATKEAFARRQVLMVPGYTETGSDENYYVTQFFGALPANVDKALVELLQARQAQLEQFLQQD